LAQTPPALLVDVTTNSRVRLSWTNTPGNILLEETDSLSPTNLWGPFSQSPTLLNQRFFVVVDVTGVSRFFRLHQLAGGLPPDPASVAPPVAAGVATALGSATEFLYTGSNPIQTGVTNGTIEFRRAAVLRGKITRRDNSSLPGVRVSILNHPELGQTLSRTDGMFDMAVNGGGQLTVRYEKDGFLAAQRAIVAPWRDYAWLPNVVMIPFDTAVTTVDLNVAAMQVARGSAMSDADGVRRATILFPQGTTAGLVMPNGTTQTVSSLNIRATEFTVGSNGPAAMPAALPPSSGYTYCVELSADEAVALGASEVRFSQPLPVYVENFLDFPVGIAVPTGYYDRQKGQWVASANGRVIKILSHTGGLADLDLDGDGALDDAAALSALGITSAERSRLAQLYSPGQTLWRVPLTHFTPWDCNWGFGPPADAIAAKLPKGKKPVVDDPDEECGSILGVQEQTLGESVPVSGTPWRLHYRSDRTPGRKDAYALTIPLSGEVLPASLRAIHVEVTIAGRLYQADFTPTTNLTHTVNWDGTDAYGRTLQGSQDAWVRIGYTYGGVYQKTERFGYNGNGTLISGDRMRTEVTLWQEYGVRLGPWDNRALGMGGWSLSIQHAYDPDSHTLLLGDGDRRRAETLSSIITTVAGSDADGFSGDGGPATAARLWSPWGVAAGPDGSLYIADSVNNRIRRVRPDGIITTVAGNGALGFAGDGGPAVMATLWGPSGIAVGPDGSLYIADAGNNRIRRVGPSGIIITVAGSAATTGFAGDGGPAVDAALYRPFAIAVGPDGSLYIPTVNRIRRVGPDGIITTIVGSVPGFSGDGGKAALAKLDSPLGVVVGPDGSIYIADANNNRIRRVGPDGIISTVAGSGAPGFGGDGEAAVSARLYNPYGVAVSADGSFYIADAENHRVRRVAPDGIITTVAGNGAYAYSGDDGFRGDGGPATAAKLSNSPRGVAVGPDGGLYIADFGINRIRALRFALPDISVSDILLSSEDGSELYLLNGAGRHLKTLDALTGTVRYQFTYAADGYLTSITDESGNVTTIERSGALPSAIVAPGGQRTALAVSSDGWLLGVTNTAGEAHTMNYSADGLLQQFVNPRGNTNTFTYDALGRLIKDEDPVGGSTTLARTELTNGYAVTTTSALGRSRIYQVEQLPTGSIRRTLTQPSGTRTVTQLNNDGSTQTTNSDGSVITIRYGPDPRWGMLAPVASSVVVKTPSGLIRTITTSRTATLSNPLNLMSLSSLTETLTDNGAVSTSVYDATSRLLTVTTPAGRRATFNLDAMGRLTREQLAGLAETSYAYDIRGLLNTIAESSGPGSRTNRFDFNPAGYLTNITDALAHSSTFAYDAAGRVTTQTFPDDRIINSAYDANGNLTRLTPPGKPAHTFEYSAVDLKTRYSPPTVVPGTNSTLYTYDLDRELTALKQPDQAAVQYDYSPSDCNCGRLSSLIQARGTNTYMYDPLTGNLTGIKAPGGIDLAFGYDGSLLTTETRSGTLAGTISNTYDSSFRLTNQSVNGSASVGFQYDLDNLLTRAGALTLTRNVTNGLIASIALGQVTGTWAYNGFGEITNSSAAFNATALYAVRFTRDQAGRIIQKTETIDGVTNQYVYNYDLGDRLAAVFQNGASVATYGYDSNNNRVAFSGPGGPANGTYDDQDRLIQYGAVIYTYTDSGNLKTRNVTGQITSYDYDALGNLITVTLPDATRIEYVIDGFSRRIGKKVNGILRQGFLYDGQLRRIAELDGSGNVVSRFVYGTRNGVPDYMIKGGTTYRLIADYLGSPRLVTDVVTGAIVQRMDYDEFGKVLADTNPGFQPFGFAGGLYDSDTKLVRFGARDYDAETGRWTAKDPIAFDSEDTNLYGYVLSDPVNYKDSSGLAGVALGGTLWIKSKNTRLLGDASYTSEVLGILQPGDEVKWLGRDRSTGLHRVEVKLAGGKRCKGFVHPSNLTPQAPSSQIDYGDGKPSDKPPVATTGATRA
jgi:RHS repeat-associated protein